MLDNRNKNIILPILEQQNINDIEKIEQSLQNIQSVISEYKKSIIIKDIIVLIITHNYNNKVNELNDTLFLLLALKKINRNDLQLNKTKLINKLFKENNNNMYLVISNIMDNLPPSVKDNIRHEEKIKLLKTLLECKKKESFSNTNHKKKLNMNEVLYANYILKEDDFRKKIITGLDGKKYFWDVNSNVLTEIDLNNLNNSENNMPLTELEHLLKVNHKFKINNLNVLEEEDILEYKTVSPVINHTEYTNALPNNNHTEYTNALPNNNHTEYTNALPNNNHTDSTTVTSSLNNKNHTEYTNALLDNNNKDYTIITDNLNNKKKIENNNNNNKKKEEPDEENVFKGEYGTLLIIGIVLIIVIVIIILLVIFLVKIKPNPIPNNNVSKIFNRN